MAATTLLELEVATPERLILKAMVSEVDVPGAEGMLGILPGHAALLSELGSGPLSYIMASGGAHVLCINGGWLEVRDDKVRVLANTAELANEIDTARAQEALRRANERLMNPLGTVDVARALNAMKRAQARIAAARLAAGK